MSTCLIVIELFYRILIPYMSELYRRYQGEPKQNKARQNCAIHTYNVHLFHVLKKRRTGETYILYASIKIYYILSPCHLITVAFYMTSNYLLWKFIRFIIPKMQSSVVSLVMCCLNVRIGFVRFFFTHAFRKLTRPIVAAIGRPLISFSVFPNTLAELTDDTTIIKLQWHYDDINLNINNHTAA